MKLGPFAFFGHLISGCFAASGAALFSQFPEFVQQYLQRLGGHRDEAWRFVDSLVQGGIATGHPVRVAAEQRFRNLDAALNEMTANRGFGRLSEFLAGADWEIARATARVFRPAVPLTLEGLAFAGLGLVAGVAIFHLLAGTGRSAWRLGKVAMLRKKPGLR